MTTQYQPMQRILEEQLTEWWLPSPFMCALSPPHYILATSLCITVTDDLNQHCQLTSCKLTYSKIKIMTGANLSTFYRLPSLHSLLHGSLGMRKGSRLPILYSLQTKRGHHKSLWWFHPLEIQCHAFSNVVDEGTGEKHISGIYLTQ